MVSPVFVAELTINHLGMVKIAKEMIVSAKKSGADYVKLKIKNVDKYYDNDAKKWRNFKFLTYRKSLELSEDDFFEIDRFCKQIGIGWYATVHDQEGLEFLRQFNPPFWKVASMDSGNKKLVDAVIEECKTNDKPLVVSIGGKSEKFTTKLVKKIKTAGIDSYLLHTVSIYPTPVAKSNTHYIQFLKENYEDGKIKIGYSGHEIGYVPSVLAAIENAHMIERHFSLDTGLKIHHIKSALEPEEFQRMVSEINEIKEINRETAGGLSHYNDRELEFLEERVYE